MRVPWSPPLLALACSVSIACLNVEGTSAEGAAPESSGAVGEVGGSGDDDGTGVVCGVIHQTAECLDAGCIPREVTPLVVDGEIDQACTFGDPVIVCSPQEENQGCADARVCSGRSTWVLPLPDGGAFAAYVEVSCGLPEGFRPCPDPADPSALVDGNALAGSATSDGGSTSDGGPEPDPLVAACECACA